MAYRIIKSLDAKRLVAYLRKQRVYSYATADGLFLAGHEAMFYITPQPELAHLHPWRIADSLPLLAEVKPTHYLYEPQEKLLLRKFNDSTHTVWLIKTLTDILQPWPGFLEE